MPIRPGDSYALALDLDRRRIGRVIAALALANAALLVCTWLRDALGPSADLQGYVLRQLDVRTERSLAAWYSSLVLLAAGIASLVAFTTDRLVRPGGSRLLDWAWVGLAMGFAGLSFDEVAALHESSAALAPNPFEGRLDDWVGVLALPMAAAVIAGLAFAWARLRHARAACLLFLAGLLLFASVPAQEQLQNWMRERYGGRPTVLALLEEGAEIYGALAFVASGLVYALRGRKAVRLEVPLAVVGRVALGAALVLGLGTFALEPGLEALGVPFGGPASGWFAGVGALLGGAVALEVWRLRRKVGAGDSWLAAALVACLVATDLGSGGALTEQLWPGSPRRQLATRLALVLCAVGTAAVLRAFRSRSVHASLPASK